MCREGAWIELTARVTFMGRIQSRMPFLKKNYQIPTGQVGIFLSISFEKCFTHFLVVDNYKMEYNGKHITR